MTKGMNPRRGAGAEQEELPRGKRGHILMRMGRYIFHSWPLFLLAVALTLLSNQLSLMGPMYSGEAIDAIADPGGVNFALAWENIVWMLICYVASAVLSYLLSVVMVFLTQRVVYAMRRQLFEKLTTLPVGYFDTHQAGDIISRVSYDIDVVNASLSQDVVQVMTSIYTVVGSLIFMWQISRPMILIFVVTVPISILFTRYRSRKLRPLFRVRSRKLGELNGYAEEMLSGSRTIRIYDREREIGGAFHARNHDAMEAYYQADYYGAALGPSVNFINNLSISLVTIFGGILYMYSQSGTVSDTSMFFITLGGVAMFVQYARKFAGPINEFANILHEFQSAFAAAERVFRVIDEEPEPADASDARILTEVRGQVDMERVSFGYTPERMILHDITIHARPGETIAIVGPTGAGKTTIINLLMRFYDSSEGRILLDGDALQHITRNSLRGAYTMVLQDTWLFHGSIYENIAYGREGATLEEVREAARAAHIDGFIMHLPEGYDTILSDDGVNLSKGQRQLITIARAMLAHTRMLILDEATSNVDSRTEIRIQQAMNTLMQGKTSFVIAHRLSTIQNADRILVLQNGQVTEQGTHNELLAAGGFYASLYNAQFS